MRNTCLNSTFCCCGEVSTYQQFSKDRDGDFIDPQGWPTPNAPTIWQCLRQCIDGRISLFNIYILERRGRSVEMISLCWPLVGRCERQDTRACLHFTSYVLTSRCARGGTRHRLFYKVTTILVALTPAFKVSTAMLTEPIPCPTTLGSGLIFIVPLPMASGK